MRSNLLRAAASANSNDMEGNTSCCVAAPRLMKMVLTFVPLGKGDAAFCAAGDLMGRRTHSGAPLPLSLRATPPGEGIFKREEESDENQNDQILGTRDPGSFCSSDSSPESRGLGKRLVRQTDTLAQRNYDSFSSRRNPSRYDIEALYQSRSLSAGAELFQRMVRDRRSESELRDAFAVLQDLFRNSDALHLIGAIGAISSAPATTWPGN